MIEHVDKEKHAIRTYINRNYRECCSKCSKYINECDHLNNYFSNHEDGNYGYLFDTNEVALLASRVRRT